MAANPLLQDAYFPAFNAVEPSHVLPALAGEINAGREQLQALLKSDVAVSYDSLLKPLEDRQDQLSRMWAVVSHLHAVCDSEALREVYQQAVAELTAYGTELAHHEGLYRAVQAVADGKGFDTLTADQKTAVRYHLRDFKLAGVALSKDDKKQFSALQQQLAKLGCTFEANVLDATQGWHVHLQDDVRMAGLPELARQAAAQAADLRGKKGFVLTLDMPCYLAVLMHAEDRSLREDMYCAFVTRASDRGPTAGKWDNSKVLVQTLQARQRMAQMLGFEHYADYSFATKMARAPQEAVDFLQDIVVRCRPVAEAEYADMQQFAKEQCGIEELKPWDRAFVSERMRQAHFNLTEEQLRPYFPLPQVMQGLFSVFHKVYGLSVESLADHEAVAKVWDEAVTVYQINDATGNARGYCYVDLFTRQHKRGGAWMDVCRHRRIEAEGGVQLPVAYVTCNFQPPVGDKPALLTHDDVLTLFHEFGHALHHILTQVDVVECAGINNVPWDAVELPSQLMEFWCWQKPVLQELSGHYETGEPLPAAMLDQLLAAKNFQVGMAVLRQCEFALFDLTLHAQSVSTADEVQAVLDGVRQEVSVLPVWEQDRFQHGFSHIFAGGYAAGYYSYLWAEVLASDTFAAFEETDIFDRETGQRFMRAVLERGGEVDPAVAFEQFRGRGVSLDAWLRHRGIA